jgi:hypothetical protein
VGILEGYDISRNLDTILEMKNVIQSQTGAVSSEFLTKVPKNVVVCLHDVRGIRRHHMEHILV